MTTAPFEPGTDPIPGVPVDDPPNPVAPGEQPGVTEPEPDPEES